MYLNINTSVHVKEHHSYSKRAEDHPGTVDCTSKLHSSTLGSRVWGKGDCGPFESPLRRSSMGLWQSIQYRYKYRLNPSTTDYTRKLGIIILLYLYWRALISSITTLLLKIGRSFSFRSTAISYTDFVSLVPPDKRCHVGRNEHY